MVIESIFSSKNKGKGEKIFIYLDRTVQKIQGKGGTAAKFGKKRRGSCRKNDFNHHTVVVKIVFERECGQACVCNIKATVYELH
jgi:hypothetical protein